MYVLAFFFKHFFSSYYIFMKFVRTAIFPPSDDLPATNIHTFVYKTPRRRNKGRIIYHVTSVYIQSCTYYSAHSTRVHHLMILYCTYLLLAGLSKRHNGFRVFRPIFTNLIPPRKHSTRLVIYECVASY